MTHSVVSQQFKTPKKTISLTRWFEILTLITHLKQNNIHVFFEWIPAHCGLRHNETVDYYAKAGLSGHIEIHNKPSLTGEKKRITQSANNSWQQRWEKNETPLREIQSLVTKPYQIALNRSQEMIIHRLRLGIIGLNEDLHKLGRHENGHCDHCPELETVDHFLISCPKYIIPRAMLLTETNLPDTCLWWNHYLKSHSPETQRALTRFVARSKRFPTWWTYKNIGYSPF